MTIDFWEYINGNQTFTLDSHRPFLCSEWKRKYCISNKIRLQNLEANSLNRRCLRTMPNVCHHLISQCTLPLIYSLSLRVVMQRSQKLLIIINVFGIKKYSYLGISVIIQNINSYEIIFSFLKIKVEDTACQNMVTYCKVYVWKVEGITVKLMMTLANYSSRYLFYRPSPFIYPTHINP